jgi:hypothetical protein
MKTNESIVLLKEFSQDFKILSDSGMWRFYFIIVHFDIKKLIITSWISFGKQSFSLF